MALLQACMPKTALPVNGQCLASQTSGSLFVRSLQPQRRHLPGGRRASRTAVKVTAFSFLRAAGLTKPRWLPDFKLSERQEVLDRFFGPISRHVYEELLDGGFQLAEQLRGDTAAPRTYGKDDWVELMCNHVAPSLPDFNWTAITDGKADKDGYALVAVQVTGHHTGAPFALPGLPPVEPSGRRVSLGMQLLRVRLEKGRVREIVVLPSEGAGPIALYQALASAPHTGVDV